MPEEPIEHEASEDCICGPTAVPVERADGSIAWQHVHHALNKELERLSRKHRELLREAAERIDAPVELLGETEEGWRGSADNPYPYWDLP